MKTYLKIVVVFILLILGFLSINDNSFSTTQVEDKQNTLISEASCCYKLSVCDRSLRSLNETNKRFCNNSSSSADYSAIEINEHLTYHNSGINSSRLRKGVDISDFLRSAIQRLLFRDKILVQDKSKTFHSSANYKVLPSCQYYVFALRRILI